MPVGDPAQGEPRSAQPHRLSERGCAIGEGQHVREEGRGRNDRERDAVSGDAGGAEEAAAMTGDCTFKIFRGDKSGGELREYKVPVETGMVVLDAIHWIQAHAAPDLACRWNCKAARCGSCSAEINGRPKLMCKTRLDDFTQGEPITVRPMKAFPVMKDLVTDVKSNYAMAKKLPVFPPRANAGGK